MVYLDMVNTFKKELKLSRELNILITWYLSSKSSKIDLEGDVVSKSIAEMISKKFKKTLYSRQNKKIKKITIKKINFSHYKDDKYKKKLVHINTQINNLKKYLKDFLIHGSFATLDYSRGWSDLDTLLIIKNDTMLSPKKLIELRKQTLILEKNLYEIDKLQHHGFIYCTESDFKFYQSFLIPIESIILSKSLFKTSIDTIYYFRDKTYWKKKFNDIHKLLEVSYKTKVFKHHGIKNRYLLENFKDKNTMYQLKYFLSLLMILPCYYLECIGEPTYKKYSYNKVKKYFLDDWSIIEKATKIRSLWSKKNINIKNNKIPKWIVKSLGKNYFKKSFMLIRRMSKELKK